MRLPWVSVNCSRRSSLWTLHADTLDENDQKSCHVNPLICVAVAFFFAEMGDKTQLATVSLAVQFNAPIAVLAGTTAGMLIADAIGIMIGVIMHRHIPQGVIHIASAVIFMLFGLIGTHHFLAARLSPALTWSLLTAVSLGALFASRFILSKEGHGS
jgi:putative Ca2+/H+ antiporter (TMEM165/GDT1 family)